MSAVVSESKPAIVSGDETLVLPSEHLEVVIGRK
jgi:hypothetical protein